MSVQIDTGTAALTGEQRLIAAMQEFVDPAIYDGTKPCRCLIGQVAQALDDADADAWTYELIVADRFGLPLETVARIFNRASWLEYRGYDAAMQMAAEELGLAPTGKEERCRE